MNYYSIQNNMIEASINNINKKEFRIAILTAFYNIDRQDNEIYFDIKEILSLFGIECSNELIQKLELSENKQKLLEYIKTCPYNRFFDFINITLQNPKFKIDITTLINDYTNIFRFYNCAVNIVNNCIIFNNNEIELQMINKAMQTGISNIDDTFNMAISMFSKSTDYNSVISKASNALESMILVIADEHNITQNTLGQAIKNLEDNGILFDEDMKNIIKSVYKYACNAGIRHGGVTPINASKNDAQYILTICSVCINYLNTLRLTII